MKCPVKRVCVYYITYELWPDIGKKNHYLFNTAHGLNALVELAAYRDFVNIHYS